MGDRNLVPAALVGAMVCCGGSALIAGLVSGVALAAIGQCTVVAAVCLGVVVGIAWVLDRRRHRQDPRCGAHDRSAQPQGAKR